MCKQNVIKLFHKVQEIGPVSIFFHNLDHGKASTNDDWHLTIPWARSCQYQCICDVLSHCFSQFKRGPLSLFQDLDIGEASTDDKCHFAIASAMFCQYQCLLQNFIKYILWFKRYYTRLNMYICRPFKCD